MELPSAPYVHNQAGMVGEGAGPGTPTMAGIKLEIRPDEPIGTVSPLFHSHFMGHLGGGIDGGI